MAIKPDRPIDIPFTRGLRHDVESKLAPTGALVRAENLEFDKLARLQRRESFEAIAETRLAKTGTFAPPARRFAWGPNGELMIFTDEGAFTWEPTANGMVSVGADGVPQPQRAALTGTGVLGADQGGSIVSCDCAVYGEFLVVAYTQFATAGPVFANNLYVDIISLSTGARLIASKNVNNTVSPTERPRVVITSDGMCFILHSFIISGTIAYSTIDLTASPLAVSSPATLVSDCAAGNAYDAAPTGVGKFVLAYAADVGADNFVNVVIYDSTAAVDAGPTGFFTAAAADWVPKVLGVIGQTGTEKIYVAGYDPVGFKLEWFIVDSTLLIATQYAVDPGLNHSFPVRQLTVGRKSATSAICAFSNYLTNGSTTDPAGNIYLQTITDAGTMATLDPVANYTIGSKFYCDADDGVFLFGRFNDPSEAQSHLMLFSFGIGASTPFPYTEFHVASGRVTDSVQTDVGIPIPLGGICASGDGRFTFAYPVRLGASPISGSQVVLWHVQALGHERFLNIQANGGQLIGGGTPCVYDGVRLTELGFYSYPTANTGNATKDDADGFIEQGEYQYRFTYEWTDATGAVHRSPASPAVIVDLSDPAYAGNLNSVDWSIPTLHATRKQRSHDAGGTDVLCPVRVVAYRTTLGRTTFYRVGSADVNIRPVGINNTATVAHVAFTDGIADADIESNEQLYVEGGGLATTAPPPCSQMAVHAQRLWGLDDEQPERIWYSKTFEPLVGIGYNPALQITIPGSKRIRGIAGQDGKVYALAETGVYLAAYGDGPNNVGQGEFPPPQLITTEAVCTQTQGVLQAQDGIYFVGNDQWGTTVYLVRRGDGTPINIGARVRDLLEDHQECRGVVERRDKGRIEFLFTNTVGESRASVLLYYHPSLLDEQGIGQWTSASYRGNDSELGAIGLWGSGTTDFTVAYDPDEERVLAQVAPPGFDVIDDAGYPWNATIETADIRPFGILGYGAINAIATLATCRDACVVKLETSFDSGQNWQTSGDYAAGGTEDYPLIRRYEPQTKTLAYGSARYRITDAQPDIPGEGEEPPTSGEPNQTVIWHGLALEADQLTGGTVRLPAAEKG